MAVVILLVKVGENIVKYCQDYNFSSFILENLIDKSYFYQSEIVELKDAIECLDANSFQVIKYLFLDGYSLNETCKIIGICRRTAEKRKVKGIVKLYKILTEYV